jgi:hypothetical protein
MRDDRITCAQKCPVKHSPNNLIINLPSSHFAALYLRNPHMKNTIYSLYAAVEAKTP